MIVNSMTGFASMSGAHEVWTWAWEMRSVNARGLDIRLRMPDGFEDLDPYIRETVKAAITRGNVSIGLKIRSDSGTNSVSLSEAALAKYISDCQLAEAKALDAGLNLAPLTGADLLSGPGVMQSGGTEQGLVLLKKQAKAQFPDLLQEFNAARASEGSAMAEIFASDGGAVGRKLDFLMQEFNREANTLCSKAGTPDLTECGVELKVIIDQMREQVQNVE